MSYALIYFSCKWGTLCSMDTFFFYFFFWVNNVEVSGKDQLEEKGSENKGLFNILFFSPTSSSWGLYRNKFKDLIPTSKFKFSIRVFSRTDLKKSLSFFCVKLLKWVEKMKNKKEEVKTRDFFLMFVPQSFVVSTNCC